MKTEKQIEMYTMSRYPLVAWDFSRFSVPEIQHIKDHLLALHCLKNIPIAEVDITDNTITLQTDPDWRTDDNIGDFPETRVADEIIEYFSTTLDRDICSYQIVGLQDIFGRFNYSFIIHFILP